MNKEIIKRIIVEKQTEIADIKLIKRNIILEPNANYVFIGLRRAGKSYMIYQHIQTLIEKGKAKIQDILYINFEDERIGAIKAVELGVLLDAYNELFDSKPIVFLDEIQNIAGWEKFARRLADSKYRVFVTGSNAKMLSKDIYTTLGGRFLEKDIFPFSFSEYLNFNNLTLEKNWEYGKKRAQVIKLLHDYFYFGGFPELFAMQDKRGYLNSLYQKILLGDIIARNEIRNENAIRVLVKKLAESVMQPSSLARIKNIINTTGTTISRNTLVDYLNFLNEAYLIFGISNFSDKLSERETVKKRYFFDNGLLNLFIINPETALLENIVAITLKKLYADDLYFYRQNIEVDFYIPSAKWAVQVAYSIADIDAFKRETSALLKINKFLPIDKLTIITYNEEQTLEIEGITIEVVPIWKFLLPARADL